MIFLFLLVAVVYDQAKSLIEKGEVLKAITMLKDEVEKNKYAYRERILLAELYNKGGFAIDAIKLLNLKFPKELEVQKNEVLSISYAIAGYRDKALELVENIENLEVVYKVYELLGMRNKLIELLNNRLEHNPDYELFLKIGKLYMQLRMYEEAVRIFLKGAKRKGNRDLYIYASIAECAKNPSNSLRLLENAPESDFKNLVKAVIYKLYFSDEKKFKSLIKK
ncbi:MAG: hypothetical protein NZ870_03870, partial [bacterium]|nr:hypothetical protein [bacterium]